MKKTYIIPEICTEEVVANMYLEIVASSSEYDTSGSNLSKERESDDFSDDDTIW